MVKYGIDQLLTQRADYQDKRIGLVCNLASVASNGIHSRLALRDAGLNLVRLFAPEHGFDSKGDDGLFINHQIDKETQIPIVSLYSEKLSPTADDLADLDLIIIDLPDIGARFYTYLWTMTYVMEACEAHAKPVLVLDRPNPMAHDISLAEGPILEEICASFIGRFGIPATHHCTFGELAAYFKSTRYPNLSLEILKMQGWSRKENNGYHFFPTSPAIQKREAVYTYPGACLFEGLNINEGRGSAHPFAQFGAPWINAEMLLDTVQTKLRGANVEIVSYEPSFGQYEGEKCFGLRVIPHHHETFQSFNYFIKLIEIIHQLHPNQLKERNYLTNVNPSGTKHLDLLIGVPDAFGKLLAGNIDTILKPQQWQNKVNPFLLYT
jgi:uncharacterized protein YbbC (DUF1343 family)